MEPPLSHASPSRDVVEAHAQGLLDPLHAVAALVGQEDRPTLVFAQVDVLQEEVSAKVFRHLDALCQVQEVIPILLPLTQVRVDALAFATVALLKELVEGLRLADQTNLLDGLQGLEDVLKAVLLTKLLELGHQVLAGSPSFSVQSNHQPLGETALLLLQIGGLLCFVIARALQVVVGKKYSLPVLLHQVRVTAGKVGNSVSRSTVTLSSFQKGRKLESEAMGSAAQGSATSAELV